MSQDMSQEMSHIMNFSKNPPLLKTLYQAFALDRKGVKQGDTLPTIEGTINNIKVNEENLSRYRKTCLIENDNALPVLYPHVMAGVLHLHIMTHPQFPLKLIGAIHKYNTVFTKRPIDSSEIFHIRSWTGSARYLPKGVEFDLHTEVRVKDEIVWSEVSTYFKRQNFKIEIDNSNEEVFITPISAEHEIANWKIDKWTGKKYATICKDFNPIHMNKFLAKLFGFQKDLAHGLCAAAQSLGKIENICKKNNMFNKKIKIYFKGPSYLGENFSLRDSTENANRYDLFMIGNQRPVMSLEIEDNE